MGKCNLLTTHKFASGMGISSGLCQSMDCHQIHVSYADWQTESGQCVSGF